MKGRRWFRKLLVAALALAVAIPLVGFGLSNLYLASPKGRIFVASKIKARTGLDASVMGSGWSPWNGISIYGIRIEQPGPLKTAIPSPLLRIESFHAKPAWKTLVTTRQFLVEGIELHKLRMVLPVELLSQLPSQPPVAVVPPTVAQVAPPAQENPAAVPPAISAPGPVPVIPEEKPAATIESVEKTTVPTVWVKFSEAGLKIVSTTSKEPLYEISDIEGAAPLAGRHAASEIALRRIRFLGKPLVESMTVPLKWRSPVLEIGAIHGGLFGMDCEAAASIALSGGMPFRIQALVPKQENQEIGFGGNMKAQFGSIAGQGIFQGQLLFPATWQGQCITQAASIDTGFADQSAHFDQGSMLVIFRNGALSCIDARLVGESLTLIGNATLLSDGRAAANGRIIAAPETLVAISKYTEPNSAAPVLTSLSTPQRSALDLQIFGRLGEFYFKPNPRSAPIPLN